MAQEAGASEIEEAVLAVVALDSSDASADSFRNAAKLMVKDLTHYHLVHVRHAKEDILLAGISDGFERYARQVEMKRHKESSLVLEMFKGLAEEAGVQYTLVELTAPHGDAREALVKYCSETGANILIMGSRGAGPAKRALMGSVSTYCMHHAPCPVMVHRGFGHHNKHGNHKGNNHTTGVKADVKAHVKADIKADVKADKKTDVKADVKADVAPAVPVSQEH